MSFFYFNNFIKKPNAKNSYSKIRKIIRPLFTTLMQGPAIELYKEILELFPSLHLIASGGISCFDDLVILKETGCWGAIVGKAIYEGKILLKQIESFLNN